MPVRDSFKAGRRGFGDPAATKHPIGVAGVIQHRRLAGRNTGLRRVKRERNPVAIDRHNGGGQRWGGVAKT